MSKTKDMVIDDMQRREDLRLQLLMADVDEVLTNHHATKPDVLAVADRLLVSLAGEFREEIGRDGALRLADQLADTVRQHLRQRILAEPQTVGEA